MSTWSKVAISVLIFFIGIVGGKTVFLLVKYFKFCKPFVNELIQFDIIDSRLKIQVLATEVFGPLVTFLIFNSICLIGCICVGTYASVAYGVSLFISIAIFPPPKDRYTMFVSLIMLLVASFAADVDGCLEMMPTYQRRLLLEGISESEYNRQTELIQDRYSAFRAKAIESQQSADNWKPVFVKYMTELIMNYMGLCGANNEMSNKIDALVRNISARINPNIGL